MAFVQNFTATQTAGNPSKIVFTDTSTGTDSAITTRRIYVQIYSGSYLVVTGTTTDYETWAIPIATATTLTLLTKDYAADITVQWRSSSAVLYTKTITYGFTLYNETMYYSLTEAQADASTPPPNIIGDSTYYSNKLTLRTEIDSGDQAISLASDITSAQACYDRATNLRLNESLYF